MTSLITHPQLLATAAADTEQIGSAISAAAAAAAGRTTGLVSAAQDEVSSLTASLFNSYARDCQAIIAQAKSFNAEFSQLLASAGSAYSQAESGAAGVLGALTGGTVTSPGSGTAPAADPLVKANLIMDGSGGATPTTSYMNAVASRYLTSFTSTLGNIPVTTAEGLYPYTGTKDLTLDISLGRGVVSLNNAIMQQIAPGATPGSTGSVAVLGRSQSGILASLVMPTLVAEGYTPNQVYFTLIGDPSNPNGGLFARFPGLTLPSLGVTFGTSTPSNDFPTTIYTLEYDGFADFPRYPIDVFSDVNALAGILLCARHLPSSDG